MEDRGYNTCRSIKFKLKDQMGIKKIEIQLGLRIKNKINRPFYLIVYIGIHNKSLNGLILNQLKIKHKLKHAYVFMKLM